MCDLLHALSNNWNIDFSFNCYLTMLYLRRAERGSCSESGPCWSKFQNPFNSLTFPKTLELRGLEGVNHLSLTFGTLTWSWFSCIEGN